MVPAARIADWAVTAQLAAALTFLVLRYVFYMPLRIAIPLVPALLEAGFVFKLPESRWIAEYSIELLPYAAMLAVAGIWSATRDKSSAGLYLLMASFWLASGFLVLSIDLPACTIFTTGTHFLWHILFPAAVLSISRAVAVADIELIGQQAPVPANLATETPEFHDPIEKISEL
jgi:hypothetical protein